MNEKDFKRRFGSRVKELREARQLTQEELAPLVELSPHQISAIERGISGTKLVAAQRLAAALGVDFVDLFDWLPRRKLSAAEERREAAVKAFREILVAGRSPTFDDIAEIITPIKRR